MPDEDAYLIYLEGGIGDIINQHGDPACGLGYAVDAKRRGHSITCLINSFWASAARNLVELHPAIDRLVTTPIWGPYLGPTAEWHEIARDMALKELSGFRDLSPNSQGRFDFRPAAFYLAEHDFALADSIPRQYIAVQARTVGLAAGAEKEWSAMHWEMLLRLFPEMLPDRMAVILGTAETPVPAWGFGHVIDLSGRTTVREAIALLLRAEALIGIDSFLRCAAYYTATPSVILYQPPPGVDPEEHFRGYFVGVEAPQNRVLRVSRLDDITPEQVYDALAEALVYAGRERRRVEILPDSKSTGM